LACTNSILMEKIQLNRPFARVLGIYILMSLNSCFLSPKLTPSKRLNQSKAENAFANGGFIVERTVDETGATLRFETKVNSFCQVSFYSQDTKPEPSPSSLNWVDCKSPQPGRLFTESVTGLDPKILYAFLVKMWGENSKAENARPVMVRENPSPGDTSVSYILQLDTTTGGALFRSIKFPESIDAIKQKHVASESCSIKSALNYGLAMQSPPGDMVISRISSRGMFLGASEFAVKPEGSRVINSGKINMETDEWVVSIQTAESSGSIRFKKPAVLKTATLKQSTTITQDFNERTLEDIDMPGIKLSATQDLSVTWSNSVQAKSASNVHIISIISHAGGDSIVCAVSGDLSTVTITKDLLAKMPKGRGYISLRTDQFQEKTSKRWAAITSDWRSLAIVF
jgi:hypothetical protein